MGSHKQDDFTVLVKKEENETKKRELAYLFGHDGTGFAEGGGEI